MSTIIFTNHHIHVYSLHRLIPIVFLYIFVVCDCYWDHRTSPLMHPLNLKHNCEIVNKILATIPDVDSNGH